MISNESKLSIAIELIETKIGNLMAKENERNEEKTEEELHKLLLCREEIYKGNYNIIDKIIEEAGEK